MSVNVKVCSFNLRIDVEVDGINKFTNRLWRVKEVINEEKPDIIGFQEMTDGMYAMLADTLTEYVIIGCGRGKNYKGESVRIAIKRSNFEIIDSETFWLSNAPKTPGSTYGGDQSGCPRITTVATVKHKDAEELLTVCNTHLDHKGKTARLLGAAQVLQYLSKTDRKFVLTGDFNAEPDEESISLITGATHAGRKINELTENVGLTFHGFSPNERCKIDYIFSDAEYDAEKSRSIAKEPIDGVYVSDHHPVIAEIKLD